MSLTSRQRWVLGGVIVLAVGARVAFVVAVEETRPGYARTPDTKTYLRPARALARTAQFETRPDSGVPEFHRTPGYPAFVAAVYVVTGESDLAVMLAQALLGAGTMLLVFSLVRAFGGSFEVALAGVLLVAFEPLQLFASARLLTEALAAFAMTATAYFGVRMIRDGFAVRWAVLLGAALGLGALIRPTTLYLPLVVAVGLALYAWVRPRWRRAALLAAFASLVPAVVILGGWMVRNHDAVASWRLSSVEGINLYWRRGAGAVSEATGESDQAVRTRLTREINDGRDLTAREVAEYDFGKLPPWQEHRQGAYFDEAYDKGLALVLDHPDGAFLATANGLGRELGVVDDVRSGTPDRVLFGLAMLALYVLAIIGVVAAARRRWGPRLPHALCVALVGYVLLISAGPEANERFRVPVMPLVAVYAALGIGTIVKRRAVSRMAADTMP